MIGVYWKSHTIEVSGKQYNLAQRHDVIKSVYYLLASLEEMHDTYTAQTMKYDWVLIDS